MSNPWRKRLLMLVTFLSLTLILSGCDIQSPTPVPTPVGNSTSSTTPLPALGDGTPQSQSTPVSGGNPRPTAATATPTAPTSGDKVAAAEAAGKIDHDTALLYQLYASYDRASLPTEYQGDDSYAEAEGTATLAQLAAHMDSLSPDMKAKVQPFFLRPDDPQSFWYQQQANSGARIPGLAAPAATTFQFSYVDDSAYSIRVWFLNFEGDELAKKVVSELDSSNMYTIEQQAMLGHSVCSDAPLKNNGGDGRLDLYLVDKGIPVNHVGDGTDTLSKRVAGVTVPARLRDGDCPYAPFIILDRNARYDYLKSVVAHELFHAFQFSFQFPYYSAGYSWWMEASATWAEDLVYPELNTEQDKLASDDSIWSHRKEDGPLDQYQFLSSAQYSSYLWAFYLTHGGGHDPSFIGQLWQSMGSKKPLDAMHDLPDWDVAFKQFALWNWNDTPVDHYRDNGQPISKNVLAQEAEQQETVEINYPKAEFDVNLGHASVAYYDLNVVDDQQVGGFVKQLHFDLSDLAQQDGAGVQAIVHLVPKEQKAYSEDWSKQHEQNFCRDRDSEYVDEVILVVTNSNVVAGNNLKGKIKVEAKSEPCTQQSASLSYSGDFAYSATYAHGAGEFNYHQQVDSNWQVALDSRDEDGNATYIFTATNRYRLNGSGNASTSYRQGKLFADWRYAENWSGSATSHNPPTPGDDVYNSGDDPTSYTTGQIDVQGNGNSAQYDITLDMAPIRPQYSYLSSGTSNCNDLKGTEHNEDSYNNTSLVRHSTSSGCSSGGGGGDSKSDAPIMAVFPTSDKVVAKVFHGSFNPRSGLIDVSDSGGSSSCNDETVSVPHEQNEYGATVGSCNQSFSIHLHVQLPPQQ